MQHYDPHNRHGRLASFVSDVYKADKSKSSSFWVRLLKNSLRLTMIGLLMASPFIIVVLLVAISR